MDQTEQSDRHRTRTPADTVDRLAVRVATITPVYKQAGLVIEAVLCALRQETTFGYAVIVVNDGCPFEETHRTCLSLARAHPDKLLYLARPNGGPSAARNSGIDTALAAFPNLEAVYFLDADNRLRPHTLQSAHDALQAAAPDVGWIYTDVNQFGCPMHWSTKGRYSVLAHMMHNYCDTGSMVRADMLRDGVRYAEDRSIGYEDWDFWLQAIDAGYRGQHLANMGFQYRRRPESRNTESEGKHESNCDILRDRHKSLYSMRRILELEQREAPRFAFYVVEQDRFFLSTDPRRRERSMSTTEFQSLFLRSRRERLLGECPEYVVFTSLAFLDIADQFGLAHGMLWQLQRGLEGANFAVSQLLFSRADECSIRFDDETTEAAMHRAAGLYLVPSRILAECIQDPDTTWCMSLDSDNPMPNLYRSCFRISHAQSRPEIPAALPSLIAFVLGTRTRSHLHAVDRHEDDNTFYALSIRHHPTEYSRALTGCPHLFTRVAPDDRPHVAFCLPIAEFGGVERVALNYAAVLARGGFYCHLFIMGRDSVSLPREFESTFDTITIFKDNALMMWPSGKDVEHYFGTPLMPWRRMGDQDAALALLARMDVVINCHCYNIHEIMGNLRRHGVATYSSLHIVDKTATGQPDGVPHQFVPYEHSFDGALVISQNMARWCRAYGIPDEKLFHVPNAPSYGMTRREVDAVLRRREERWRTGDEPLRVLFIGRFDRQKGIDRLARIVERCEAESLPVSWQIVGKRILDDDEPLPHSIAAHQHPFAQTPTELTDYYSWADVMVMPSRFEGVPLTILEAGRLGCVVLATNVGAVSEIVDDTRSGRLFDDSDEDALVQQMYEALLQFVTEPDYLHALSRSTATLCGQASWERSLQPFVEHLASMRARRARAA